MSPGGSPGQAARRQAKRLFVWLLAAAIVGVIVAAGTGNLPVDALPRPPRP